MRRVSLANGRGRTAAPCVTESLDRLEVVGVRQAERVLLLMTDDG